MQIVSLGVFNKTGKRRDVFFQTGALNILTGKSKTGKSAILDVVEYCLGRNTVTIPSGVISDNASWYYIIVQFSDERLLICRPNPETASTQQAMLRTGDLTMGPPSYDDLEVNADTDVLREALTERLGIESFTVDPESGSLRQPFDISVRHALFYCFQNQGEVASRDVLFHRQIDGEIKNLIRETLPYFLGAATPEQGAIRRQIIATRRTLQRTRNSLRAAETDVGHQGDRITHLVESAVSLDMLSSDAGVDARTNVHALLESILAYRPDASGSSDTEGARRRENLVEEGRAIRTKIREIDAQVELLGRLQGEQGDSATEAQYQRDRLRALDFLLPKSAVTDGDESLCPLCDQTLQHPDETVDELRSLLHGLETRLASSKGISARRAGTIDRLRESRLPLLEALQDNVVELDALAQQETAIILGRERHERISFLQGRVSQELERGVDIAQDVATLKNAERRYRGQLAKLEEASDRDDPAVALKGAIDAVSNLMTDYARHLELENSEHYVRLDPVELTVAVMRSGTRIPLTRMGSAENWVGYHLAAHLALHHWFTTNNCPVPRFIMVDQPTQAFFPEEVVDAADDENADWEAVRRQFTLMRDVATELNGNFQIIVCDHANLADNWFQEAVVENWRNGVAFIPTDWLLDDLL
ncbi:DUF3732 domain-containing protein [Paenarthrobacter aromaticivorans]|uniref:DUF3732 domain-containing protein n=1 Tax=Paenarthrobacter aromaticivorans TaxID=2849150 RepID=A0ABS6I2I2_9MICC|nr:DUF3732 domain-containing protein [Paenarthrobacter sp. MMS21-TAE1-1]MBU8865585.1 DUF3732 domain-containing protein [Paenarthrobacter sp. MMS21-TAE1-1]